MNLTKQKLRQIIRETINELDENPCWDGYTQLGTKMKDGKEVPNCVPVSEANVIRSLKEGDTEYQAYFRKELEKTGKSSPADMTDDEKREFFSKVDKGWNGKTESKIVRKLREGDTEYQAYFRKELEKTGKSSPADMTDDEKRDFFSKVDKGWSGKTESVNEGKKVFKVNPGIGKAKYSISSHDGKKKHKDGSDFYDIEIFNNKVDLEKGIKKYTSNGFVKESVNEAKFGKGDTVRVIDRPKYVLDKTFWNKSGYVKDVVSRDTVLVTFPNGRTILVDKRDLEMNENQSIKEGNAFGMAVTKAKQEGKKEFEFNGKKYKVKKGSYEKNEAKKEKEN
jgi:hypothetical protein